MRNAKIEDVQTQLDFFFSNLRDRWQIGLDLFKEQIDFYCDEITRKSLKRRDIINTPIHNIITIEGSYIFLLLDSIFMQRLRGIHHQGLGYLVYPTATHSRFEHSLGAFKLIDDIIKSMKIRDNANFQNCEYSETELKIAALLHDIGHYAFSHIGETIFEDFINRNKLRFDKIVGILPENHEIRSADILLGKDLFTDLRKHYKCKTKPEDFFERLFEKLNSDNPNESIKLNNICDLISKIIKEFKDKKRIEVKHLINGPLDVDKLDYIMREAYFTGTPFGNIDIYRIIKGYAIGRIIKEKSIITKQLVFNKRMVPSILQMYVGREFNYLQISYHRTVRIAETTLKCVAELVMNEYLEGYTNLKKDKDFIEDKLCKILLHFKLMEDRDFLHFLEIMVDLSPVAKKLFNRLLTRTLYKGWGYFPSIDYKEIFHPDDETDFPTNRNLLLHLPTNFLDILFNDKKLKKISLKHWNEDITDDVKEEVKKFSKEITDHQNTLKKEKENVFLINLFDYPFDDEGIKEQIRKKLADIHTFDENKMNENTKSLAFSDMGKSLIKFLTQIHKENSNIIFAFDKSLLTKIEKKVKNLSPKAVEAIIFLALDYNGIN